MITRVDNNIYKTSHKKGFDNEVECLQRLKKNFINNPEISHFPFPQILSINETELSIQLTNCGDNLIVNNQKISPTNLNDTIQCIFNNLIKSNIQHLDIHPKNICINERGEISLIDFGKVNLTQTTEQLQAFYKKPSNICMLDNTLEDLKLEVHKQKWWSQNPWSMLCITQNFADRFIMKDKLNQNKNIIYCICSYRNTVF